MDALLVWYKRKVVLTSYHLSALSDDTLFWRCLETQDLDMNGAIRISVIEDVFDYQIEDFVVISTYGVSPAITATEI